MINCPPRQLLRSMNTCLPRLQLSHLIHPPRFQGPFTPACRLQLLPTFSAASTATRAAAPATAPSSAVRSAAMTPILSAPCHTCLPPHSERSRVIVQNNLKMGVHATARCAAIQIDTRASHRLRQGSRSPSLLRSSLSGKC
jgi:hypothetical protein